MRWLPIAVAALICAGTVRAGAIRVGPGGVRIAVTTAYYEDRHHRRHAFEVPADWRDYPHPLAWYRAHPRWWENRSWYRADDGIDGTTAQSDTRPSHS